MLLEPGDPPLCPRSSGRQVELGQLLWVDPNADRECWDCAADIHGGHTAAAIFQLRDCGEAQ